MNQTGADLAPFFKPRSVAIFGSFKKSFFGGYCTVRQLLGIGFTGKIYPINPRYDNLFDIKVYPSIKDVPEDVDLAMMMTSNLAIPQLLTECAEKGVKAAIIVSDGFAERGGEGTELQRTIVDIAKRGGIRIIGPNTAGMMSTVDNMISCAFECGYERAKQGGIAIIGQTGLLGPQSMPWHEFNCGINKLIDLGNKCDVNESDILEYLGDDPTVKVIAFHLEDIKEGPRFFQTAKEVIKKKPILVLKAGRTKEGAKALVSHTGSLAGDDKVFDAVCKQIGIIRVDRWSELIDFAKMLAHQPLPKGNRLGILTASGGGAAIMIDAAAQYGMTTATLSSESSERLRKLYPPTWGSNPIDYGAPASFYGPDRWFSLYQEGMEVLMTDDNVDCVATISSLDPFGGGLADFTRLAESLRNNLSKPVATWVYGAIPAYITELTGRLESLGFPVYTEPDTPIKALSVMYKYSTVL